MTPTHEQVLAAIDAARDEHQLTPNVAYGERHQHCDDLRATAERHAPVEYRVGLTTGLRCCRHARTFEPWPCPDYQQVIDRLRAWGHLTERTDR